MSGHLVLSTLHTNDAIGAIARLSNIGVEPGRGVAGSTGRLPIIEFLEITPELRGMITTGKLADEIRSHALRTGALHTFDNDALWHIAEGDTTAEEVIPYTEFERRRTPRNNTPRVNAEFVGELDENGLAKPSKVLLALGEKAD